MSNFGRHARHGPKPVHLYVDDPRQDTLHARLLENFGFAVVAGRGPADFEGADDAEPPVAAVIANTRRERLDLVLDHFGALANTGARRCPAIFVGNYADLEQRLASVRAGCGAFLGRPVNPMVLVDTPDRLTGPLDVEPLRVMIVDDSPTVAQIISTVLKAARMITLSVTEPMRALAALSEFQPQLILMDLNMPGCDGEELAAVIRQDEVYDSIPIVFLSAEQRIEKQFDAMRRGGDDFLTKPIDPASLIRAVSLRAQRFRKLRANLYRDSLTGLLNHSTSKKRISLEVDRARVNGNVLSLAIFDIDNFKRVNDIHGRAIGDLVIKSLARFLRQNLRATDIVGRVGGEEFLAVLPGLPASDARRLLDRLRAEFSAIEYISENETFTCTFSCGVADTLSYPGPTTLGDGADKALYEAKAQGRDQIVGAGDALAEARDGIDLAIVGGQSAPATA